jgi:hypothetical protein
LDGGAGCGGECDSSGVGVAGAKSEAMTTKLAEAKFKMKLGAALLALTICLLSPFEAAPAASDSSRRLTGIYSDLRQSKETNDLDGTEMIIVGGAGSPSGYYVFYQFWEGGSLPPVVVPVEVKGNKISFTVPAPSGECGHFEGTISAKGFTGTCTIPHPDDATKELRVYVPRKLRSFWQDFRPPR